MITATALVDGSRQEQLRALQQRLTWTHASVHLTMPLLCCFVPPKCFDTRYKNRQQCTKTAGETTEAQVSQSHSRQVQHGAFPDFNLIMKLAFTGFCSVKAALTRKLRMTAACSSIDLCLLQSKTVHRCVVRLPLETILHNCANKIAMPKFMQCVEELYGEKFAEVLEHVTL